MELERIRRTIVLSDVHGYPELIENALGAAEFRQGADELIFAGDFVDRGGRARECLKMLDELGAQTLIGNHDQAIALGYWIGEQQAASKAFCRTILKRIRSRRLNDEYHAAVARLLEHGAEWPEPRTVDEYSPLWLRVDDADVGPDRLLDGVEQIAGHTTPLVFRRWTEEDFRDAGLYCIDPGTYGLGRRDHPAHYRYAVIEGGRVRVEAGAVLAAR
jgi:hypothetical protein